MIVSATLSNSRVGVAVILDAANSSSSYQKNYVDPEVRDIFQIFLSSLLFFHNICGCWKQAPID